MKDILDTLKKTVKINDFDKVAEEEKDKEIVQHQIRIAHDYDDIKEKDLDDDSAESIEKLLKKTSKLKALEMNMHDQEKQYDDWKSDHNAHAEVKESKEAQDKQEDELMKAGLKVLASPDATEKSSDVEKTDDLPKLTFKTTPWEDEQLEKSFAQKEGSESSGTSSQLDNKYDSDSTGNNTIPRREEAP